jgi:hypothetical protein
MAAQNASFDEDSQSVVSSTLSTTPVTSILDQIDNELRGIGQQAEETLNVQIPEQAPKRHTYHQKVFIKTVLKRQKHRAWYWAHGTEYEL